MEPDSSYSVQRNPPAVTKPLNPVYTPKLCFPKILFNINHIYIYMSESSEWFVSLNFPAKTLYAFLISPMRATCPASLTLHHTQSIGSTIKSRRI
jgi:hypothetical protein